MKKSTKVWLITAALLVALGLLLFAGAMTAYDWDAPRLGTVTYVTNSYELQDEFDKISISVDIADVEFSPSADNICRVVCYEDEDAKHSAVVEDGTLVIRMADERKWYEYISVSLGSPKITVCLPQREYASLLIETNTGDIDLGSLAASQIGLSTATGDISINNINNESIIDIETDTGTVELANVSCAEISVESDTGSIAFDSVVASGSFLIESDTGDVSFEASDAAQLSIRTGTGNVRGTLLSEKIFTAESSTGSVSVPQTTSGGKCEITTSTGSIKIAVNGTI